MSKIEVLVVRDPDNGTDVTVFVDGVKVTFTEETVDPGYGCDREEWTAQTEAIRSRTDAARLFEDYSQYSEAFAAMVADSRDEYADSEYLYDEGGW